MNAFVESLSGQRTGTVDRLAVVIRAPRGAVDVNVVVIVAERLRLDRVRNIAVEHSHSWKISEYWMNVRRAQNLRKSMYCMQEKVIVHLCTAKTSVLAFVNDSGMFFTKRFQHFKNYQRQTEIARNHLFICQLNYRYYTFYISNVNYVTIFFHI